MGLGRCQAPSSGQPFPSACPVRPGQPSANSSPALAAELGNVLGAFLPCSSSFLPFLSLSLTSPPPRVPCLLHRGWSGGPCGSRGRWAQAGDGLLLGPLPPQSSQPDRPGKSSAPSGAGMGFRTGRQPTKAAHRPPQREQRRCYRAKPTTVCPGRAAALGGWEPDGRGPGSSAGPATVS